jgi:hypothetical protein
LHISASTPSLGPEDRPRADKLRRGGSLQDLGRRMPARGDKMKKSLKKLQLNRETVQNLIASELRIVDGAGTANAICSRLQICTQTCGHICP